MLYSSPSIVVIFRQYSVCINHNHMFERQAELHIIFLVCGWEKTTCDIYGSQQENHSRDS